MPDLIGRTLGGYRITEQIGLGGMATVYKAYQPSMNRYVALKLLSPHLAQDPSVIERFRQEAKVVAQLEHLHILPVYDHGEEDGYLFLVMRFIQAGTLKDRLARESLSLDEVRRIVSAVGSALEYAHQAGVVHRDLKPTNILIDAQGNCYLTDFGIAKMIESTLGLTGSNILGTPHYMAPEQCQARQVDRRADIYAMGVMIYEMVTGKVPFDAETPLAVAIKHLSEPLPLPRHIKPDLPEEVERVILKALAKNPDDRYQHMRDLVADFDQVVRSVSATSPFLPATVSGRQVEEPATVMSRHPPTGRPWFRRQPVWLWVTIGLLLVAGLFWMVLTGTSGPKGTNVEPAALAPVEATETPTPVVKASPTPMLVAVATATATIRPSSTPTATPTATATPSPTLTRTPRPTKTATPVPDAVVTTKTANVRAGPGLSYEIINQVNNGDPVRVIGRNAAGDWLQIVVPGQKRGWISGSLLEVNLSLAEVAEAAIPPSPTPSVAEQARAFAEPILAAIANRPPDYQDDFSNPGSGWYAGQEDRGETGYKDGKYFVRSTLASSAFGDWGGPVFADFVLEVEAQFVSGEEGNWFIVLRDWREPNPPQPGFYSIEHNLHEDSVFFRKHGGPQYTNVFGQSFPHIVKPDDKVTRVMAILKGNQLAFYVNDRPVGLVTDDTFSRGAIGLAAGTDSDDTPLEVHFDNLKVWDISNISFGES